MIVAMAFLAALATPQSVQADTIICQVGRPEVGTHMRPKPVCMTRSQWAELEQNTNTQVDRFKEHGAFDPGRAGPLFCVTCAKPQ